MVEINNMISFCVFTIILLFFLAKESMSDDVTCYKELGCFSTSGAFSSSTRPVAVIPSSLDSIRTMFVLYTKLNPKQGQELDARKIKTIKTRWTHFQKKKTKFIIHGFLDDYNLVSWPKKMKDEFLKHGDLNVIIVDWHHGNLPPYTQATANTRVVGAQTALLIKELQSSMNVPPSDVHIIGHSLGAHVAGYAGERVPGLARITGLDPAGPYFEGTDKVVRLDRTDAEFVDNIHTDGNNILEMGYGTLEPMGHLDFYPNQGHDQPGCNRDIIHNVINLGFLEGAEETVACNHLRSIKFFIESINSKCPFISFPCNNAEDFKNKRCYSCPSGGCASMGLHADQFKPPKGKYLKYFTTTASAAPFCQYHVNIKVEMAYTSHSSAERGFLKFRLHESEGVSDWINFNKDPMVFNPGSTYEREMGVPSDFGSLQSVDLQWHHKSSLTNPLKWNLFGWRHPKLYFHEVDIRREEKQQEVHFCTGDEQADNNAPLSVYRKCK